MIRPVSPLDLNGEPNSPDADSRGATLIARPRLFAQDDTGGS